MRTPTDIWIGIDPGVNTGIATWNAATKKFVSVQSMSAIKAETTILAMQKLWGDRMTVLVEDSRSNYVPPDMRRPEQIKGVGSVHRDCSRWQEFLEYHQVKHAMMPLSRNPLRKSSSADFKRITGYQDPTNAHGRDAAALVYGH